jgi:hypothetical protein
MDHKITASTWLFGRKVSEAGVYLHIQTHGGNPVSEVPQFLPIHL